MGSISSLIVSPCVSAPLVGVLAYIAETGDKLLGFVALLALGFGMGTPLLLLGASAGSLLPKAGPWMLAIERLMGILMIAFAIIMLSRIMPGSVSLLFWGIFFISIGIYLGVFRRGFTEIKRLRRSLGLLVFMYGIILTVGAGLGNADPFNPWGLSSPFAEDTFQPLTYIEVKNELQLEQALLLAKQQKKYVMLDFYADWCSACIKMEREVLIQPSITQVLTHFTLLRANVTANTHFDQTLLKKFNVVAPPTFLFFDPAGKELTKERIVGETTTTALLNSLIQIQEQ